MLRSGCGAETVNGVNTKPAHEARAGEIVTVRIGVMTRTLRVIGAPPSRVAGKLVAQFADDLTPPEEFEKRRSLAFGAPGARARGAGRPTKRERRDLDEWAG